MAVCKSITVTQYEPSITVTDVRVVRPGGYTEITTWREDEEVEILVDLENTAGTGKARVKIYYDNTEIDRYDSV